MKKILLLFLVFISAKTFSQEHWEDNFWRDAAKKRYSKTFTMAGLYTEFYNNGQIKWQGKCLENGNPDSVWVYYGEEGKKLWEGEYNGKYYEYKKYNTYGENIGMQPDTAIIGNYKNGLKNGEWLEYDDTGKYISKKGYYLNGEPTGIWQEFKEVTVETEVRKSAEYNYKTQTRTLYKLDSIDGTSHIDSLDYANEFGFTGRENNNGNANSDYFNICYSASLQYLNFASLNHFFYQSKYSTINSPLESIGMEWSGTVPKKLYWSGNINWTPAASAQLNDSIRLRLSGYSSSFCMGIDLIKANGIDLAPTLGIGFQQLKLKVLKIQKPDSSAYAFNEGDFRVYHNPALTLNAILNLRMNLGSFSINLSGGYVFDCSSPKWRYNGKLLLDSPSTSLSGLVANFSIGFHIPSGGTD
ncbi:MAG: hypothetical protein NTX97_14655 [Bacteroidetes bacterium]|nr:hypothetical protein [Bacteroidota bacterium]